MLLLSLRYYPWLRTWVVLSQSKFYLRHRLKIECCHIRDEEGIGAFSEDDQGSSALHEDVDASANVLLELGRVPVTPKNTAGSQDISRVEDQLHPKRTYDQMQTPYGRHTTLTAPAPT
jgi:hypothetical protein